MFLRVLLGLIMFWAAIRFLRSLTAFLLARISPTARADSTSRVQSPPRKSRNPIEGDTVIDVEFTESESRSRSEDHR